MSTTSLDVFDRTLQKTNMWLNQIMEIMGWEDRHAAYTALRAILHALRDRLTVQEAAQHAAQLPMLIRGIDYEGWNPAHTPAPERHLDQFLARSNGNSLGAARWIPRKSPALSLRCWRRE